LRVSYAPGYYAPIPHEHIFPMGKFPGLFEYLTANKIIPEENVIAPSMVDMTNLLLIHSHQYANGIMEGTLNKKEVRRMGLPWSKALAVRSRMAVQGTINAAIMALQDGMAGNLAGGTHHAMADHGEGYCVFNDVAVAVEMLQRSFWAKTILIIDCDVHQGNGTAKLLQKNDHVFTFSLHGEKNYPFKKPASSLDIGLPDGTKNQEYLNTLREALDSIFDQFNPDLVFYLGGIDPLETDHLGRLALTKEGLFERDQLVIRTVRDLDKPLVLLLSGGYAPTLQQTVEAHALMYKAAKKYIDENHF